MAALGAGDPRWIVRERADGTNCGDWHWAETNITDKAHSLFRSRVADSVIPDSDGFDGAVTFSLVTVTGNVSMINRKGRKYCNLEDCTMELSWTTAGGAASGTVKLPDVENINEEYVCNWTCSSGADLTCPAQGALLPFLRKQGRTAVTQALRSSFRELEEAAATGRAPVAVEPRSLPTPVGIAVAGTTAEPRTITHRIWTDAEVDAALQEDAAVAATSSPTAATPSPAQ